MANTYVAIATTTVGAGGASSIDFTNIPQTYTDLVILSSIRTNRASTSDWVSVTINGVTTNQTDRYLQGDGSTVVSGTGTKIIVGQATGSSNTASTFGNSSCYIPNYTGSNNKSFSTDAVNENNATAAFAYLRAGLWSSSSAITSLSLTSESGSTIQQYSTATLYGIKNS